MFKLFKKPNMESEYFQSKGFKTKSMNGYTYYENKNYPTIIVKYKGKYCIVYKKHSNVFVMKFSKMNDKYLDTRTKYRLDELYKSYDLGSDEEYKLFKRNSLTI